MTGSNLTARNADELPFYFSADDLAEIDRIANARQAIKDANRALVNNYRMSTESDLEIHRRGVAGEYAVGKFIGLPVDDKAYLAGDRRGDFLLFNAWVEVKVSRQDLKFNADLSDFRADVAVLVVYEPVRNDVVWLQGFMPKRHFGFVSFEDDFRHGPRRCVRPERMASIHGLASYCMGYSDDKAVLRRIAK